MNIVIARMIAPDQFGVFAVALTVFSILTQFSDLGTASAVVREIDRTDRIAPTVNTIVIGTAIFLATLMALTAPYLTQALGSADATGAVRVLSLTMLIGSFGTLPAAILTRDYQQKLRFAADVTSFFVASVVLILLAFLGGGVMALAWSRVAGVAASSVLLAIVVRERYWPGFNKSEAWKLIQFSIPLAGANTLSTMMENVDFIVIARLRGTLQLGYYNLAFSISGWPVSMFSSVLDNVTMTTLARVRTSDSLLRKHFRAALAALSGTSFLVSSLCAAIANPLIITVYGERWAPAANALGVLAILGSYRVILKLMSDLLVALGMTRRLFMIQALWIIVLIPAMIVGVHFGGITGAGWAHIAVATVIVGPAYLITIRRRTMIGIGWMFRVVLVPFVGAIAAGVVARFTADVFEHPVAAALAGVGAGTLTYLGVTGIWLLRNIRDIRSLYGRQAASDISVASGEDHSEDRN